MTRIAFGISYDGSAYFGWQDQENLPSIQGALTQAVSQVANHPVSIICAGRTDKGVHALEQIVHFDTTANRSLRSWVLGTNTHLPPDIRVQWARNVDSNFHARYSALARRYRYVIYNHAVASPLLFNKVTWCHQNVDEKRMSAAAHYLVGEHDFSSYRAVECQAHSPIRTIYELTVTREGRFVFIDVEANGFLHHMVRNIAGVFLEIAEAKREAIWAQEVLHARDRTLGGITAPAQGLYFVRARYDGSNFPHD